MVRAGFTVEGSELKQQRFRAYPSPSRRSLVGLSFRARVQGLGFTLRLLCPPPPWSVVFLGLTGRVWGGGCRGGGGYHGGARAHIRGSGVIRNWGLGSPGFARVWKEVHFAVEGSGFGGSMDVPKAPKPTSRALGGVELLA